MSLKIRTLLPIIILALAQGVRADTCLDFITDPEVYVANAGSYFEVSTTYTNCGTEYIWIGEGFGSDQNENIIDQWFFDPEFVLGPGASGNVEFGTYQWSSEAPAGYTWTSGVNVFFAAVEGPCNSTDEPCSFIGSTLRADSEFTAMVTPVPEPATMVLLGTGLAAIWLRKRRAPRG